MIVHNDCCLVVSLINGLKMYVLTTDSGQSVMWLQMKFETTAFP